MSLKCFELVNRYFTGHTENPDGSSQFQAGKTKIGDAIDGAIKIVTVAVCVFIRNGLCTFMMHIQSFGFIFMNSYGI